MPTLPRGRRLTLHLHSTYGDSYYIGLAGLDLFDGSGKRMSFGSTPEARKSRITASPADLNVLPGYHNDPRVVSNLLDGVNASTDDMHAWLAPFSAGKRHVVVIELAKLSDPAVTLSLIRVWNFNKSRIHAARGVRHMSMVLDGNQLIFQGEVSKAPGNVEEAPDCSENILFTTEPNILARIAAHSARHAAGAVAAGAKAMADEPTAADDFETPHVPARPPTGGASTGADTSTSGSNKSDTSNSQLLSGLNVHTSVDFTVARPKTSAVPHLAPPPSTTEPAVVPAAPKDWSSKAVTTKTKSSTGRFSFPCAELTLTLLSTWGDPYFVGLTGLALLDEQLRPLPTGNGGGITHDCLSAFPRDINTVPGHSGDNRTLDKLIDGDNVTTNDNHMWLAPVLQADEANNSKKSAQLNTQWLRVKLPASLIASGARVSALRVWNYNKTDEDTYRGMRAVRVTGVHARTGQSILLSPHSGFVLRKAPGHADFDFGQTIFLQDPSRPSPSSPEVIPESIRRAPDITMPSLPKGFLLKFLFLSTHGDAHYVGLNGLELFDHRARRIAIGASNVCAVPSSLNDLSPPPNPPDSRTVNKLFDGRNDTWDDRHMWLAPLLPSNTAAAVASGAAGSSAHMQPRNALTLFFDAPIALGAIKVWNYSKTPSRGVQNLQILMDDVIIWDGVLRIAPGPPASKSAAAASPPDFAQTLLFCSHPTLLSRESARVYHEPEGQDVLLVDERRVVSQPGSAASTSAATAGAASKNQANSAKAARPQTMARGH
jgi:hypothetical protein